MIRRRGRGLALVTALLAAMPAALPAGPAAAQDVANMTTGLPGQLEKVGFDQRLGESLPLHLELTDSTGERVRLGDFFGLRPVLLVPVYYDCPMLCGLVLNGLTTSLRALRFAAGSEFEVVAFSFDPRETPEQAARRKAVAVDRYDRAGSESAWHFLTGDEEAIASLTGAIGFRYTYDAEIDQFAHAAGLVLATPDGRIARYFYGVEYAPRDLRLGMVEAADGRIGGLIEQVLLFCFHYDPAVGRYSAFTMNLVRLGGAATLLALAIFLFVMLRREFRRTSAPDAAGPVPAAPRSQR